MHSTLKPVKATLVIPSPAFISNDKMCIGEQEYRIPLEWTGTHYMKQWLGVFLDPSGEWFHGPMFCLLRDTLGAWIETDDPGRTISILRVFANPDGIGKPPTKVKPFVVEMIDGTAHTRPIEGPCKKDHHGVPDRPRAGGA